MNFPLVFAIFLGMWSHKIISASSDIYQRIQNDLKNMTETCTFKSTCVEARTMDTSSIYSCHCSEICTRLNTCCADSQHTNVKPPELVQTCRSIDNSQGYFMVDRCPKSDSVWESLCHEEWNGEDNAMKLVPVTSLFTHITYKNYFCFRCHESGDDFLYWKVNLESNDYEFDDTVDKDTVSLNYDQTYRSWVAPLGKGGVLIPVNMTIEVPSEIWPLSIYCQLNVISHCSEEWTDIDVRDKCEAYMGIVYIMQEDWNFIKYRNVHCALCNFEDLENVSCGLGGGAGFAAKVPFPFTHLLDVNRSDGFDLGKVRRCGKDSLWDPYAKKCRALVCALPGYVVKDGKCTPP